MKAKDKYTGITIDRVQDVIVYKPASGQFFWANGVSRQRTPGQPAGYFHKRTGYLQIKLDGFNYLGHRLAFFYMTGRWPQHELDHADGDRANNKWSNLRECERGENCANRGTFKNNLLGVKGVTMTRFGKYVARIRKDGRLIHIGTFDDIESAEAAYKEQSTILHKDFSFLL